MPSDLNYFIGSRTCLFYKSDTFMIFLFFVLSSDNLCIYLLNSYVYTFHESLIHISYCFLLLFYFILFKFLESYLLHGPLKWVSLGGQLTEHKINTYFLINSKCIHMCNTSRCIFCPSKRLSDNTRK